MIIVYMANNIFCSMETIDYLLLFSLDLHQIMRR